MATKTPPPKKADKKNQESDKSQPKKSPEKKAKKSKPKGGGFFSFLFKVIILLVLVGIGYYGYLVYVESQKNGGDYGKAFKVVMGVATKDYEVVSKKTKEISINAYNKTAEFSVEAYKNSEEYLKTVKEFTKESFDELSEKVKKIGEKSPAELNQDADNYLKEFMSGKEIDKPKEVAYEPKVTEHENKVDQKPPVNNNTSHEPPKVEKKNPDPVKENGFVEAEKTKEPTIPKEIKEVNDNKKEITKPEEPKKTGLTLVGTKAGPKNEEAINKNVPESKTPEKISDKTKEQNIPEPPHMKKYKEGRAYFLEGLEHYKKQMPGSKNEHVHRRKAYALFKKASACFDQVSKKMEGNEEFDRISMDNQRFMFGCGKSMLVDQH